MEILPCLYCSDATGSKEHILASGLGGRLVDTTLVCGGPERQGGHNNICAQWADDPLCKQFEFAVHSLEVRKGSGDRGTTWHGIPAHTNGIRADVLTDFSQRAYPDVTKDATGVFRVAANDSRAFAKIEKNLSKIMDPGESHTEIREFNHPAVSTGGPGTRGVLKAALHFVASRSTDHAAAQNAARHLAGSLFSHAIPEIVQVLPYSDDSRAPEFHELVAWNESPDLTIVVVTLFNLVSYRVMLPFIPLQATRYHQNIITGDFVVELTDVPVRLWDPDQDFQSEFSLRADRIMALSEGKAQIAEIIEKTITASGFRDLASDVQRSLVMDAVKRQFRLPRPHVKGWMWRHWIDFRDSRVTSALAT